MQVYVVLRCRWSSVSCIRPLGQHLCSGTPGLWGRCGRSCTFWERGRICGCIHACDRTCYRTVYESDRVSTHLLQGGDGQVKIHAF